MEEALIKLNLIGVGSIGDALKQKVGPMKCYELGEEDMQNTEKLPERDNR